MIRAKSRPSRANRRRIAKPRAARAIGLSRRRNSRRGKRQPAARAERRRARSAPPSQTVSAYREGTAIGAAWRAEHPDGAADDLKAYALGRWRDRGAALAKAGWREAWERSKAFGEGVMNGAGFAASFVPLPLKGSAAAVVCATPAGGRLLSLLEELGTLPLQEIVIVAGQASEWRVHELRRQSNAVIAHVPEPLDDDVGRALGAKLTGADTVLFLDGEQPATAMALGRFLWECDGRLDAALNDLSFGGRTFDERSDVQHLHEFMNVTLHRPDLQMNTMASLPFALSRNALDAIGPAQLAVPIKAHAAAVLQGLKVGTAGSVPLVPGGAAGEARMRAAAGDHAEAWRAAMALRGSRLYFEDRLRNRKAVGGVVDDASFHHHTDA